MGESARYQTQDDGGITYQPNRDHSQDMRFPSPAALPRLDGYDLRTFDQKAAAQLAADEARLVDAETRIEQLEATVSELRDAVQNLARIMHRYINGTLSGDVDQEQ